METRISFLRGSKTTHKCSGFCGCPALHGGREKHPQPRCCSRNAWGEAAIALFPPHRYSVSSCLAPVFRNTRTRAVLLLMALWTNTIIEIPLAIKSKEIAGWCHGVQLGSCTETQGVLFVDGINTSSEHPPDRLWSVQMYLCSYATG